LQRPAPSAWGLGVMGRRGTQPLSASPEDLAASVVLRVAAPRGCRLPGPSHWLSPPSWHPVTGVFRGWNCRRPADIYAQYRDPAPAAIVE